MHILKYQAHGITYLNSIILLHIIHAIVALVIMPIHNFLYSGYTIIPDNDIFSCHEAKRFRIISVGLPAFFFSSGLPVAPAYSSVVFLMVCPHMCNVFT